MLRARAGGCVLVFPKGVEDTSIVEGWAVFMVLVAPPGSRSVEALSVRERQIVEEVDFVDLKGNILEDAGILNGVDESATDIDPTGRFHPPGASHALAALCDMVTEEDPDEGVAFVVDVEDDDSDVAATLPELAPTGAFGDAEAFQTGPEDGTITRAMRRPMRAAHEHVGRPAAKPKAAAAARPTVAGLLGISVAAIETTALVETAFGSDCAGGARRDRSFKVGGRSRTRSRAA